MKRQGRKEMRDAEGGREAAQKEGKDKNGEREQQRSKSSQCLAPA